MLTFIARRFLQFVPTFIGATVLAFVIIQVAPGDFTTQFVLGAANEQAAQQLERLRSQLGLDQHPIVQYFRWFASFVTSGYLGESFASQQPVAQLIRRPILNSMLLVALGLVLINVIGIAAGVYAAVRQYSLGDQVITVSALIGLSIPNFFQALLLILLALKLREWTGGAFILPTGQMTSVGFEQMTPLQQALDRLWHMTTPLIVLVTSGAAGPMRFMRGQMLEFLRSDFIRTARAKGLNERTINYKHALRNAIVPFVAGIGNLLPALVGGAGLVELVYGWPGITPLILASVFQSDLYVLMGATVLTTTLLIFGNLVSDILLAVVDPRIRYI